MIEHKPKKGIIAYKGFDKGLVCRGYKYEEGEVHVLSGTISLCYKGFHYCYSLSDVLNYYNKDKSTFAIVEPLGKEMVGEDKACTDILKIIRVLTNEEVDIILKQEKEVKLEEKVFKLHILRELQENFNLFIGGSAALFINRLVLDRDNSNIDLDIIMPYYQNLTDIKSRGLISEIEEFDGKKSGNDYDKTYALTTVKGDFIKLDVRIDPKQSYELVEYKGYKYKTSKLIDILEAKCRYAKEGNEKHLRDMKYLLNFSKDNAIKSKEETIDGIFRFR